QIFQCSGKLTSNCNRGSDTPEAVRIKAQGNIWPKGFTKCMNSSRLLPRLKNSSFELNALESKQADEVLGLLDDALRRKRHTCEVLVPLPGRSRGLRQPIRSANACIFVEEIGTE